MKFQRHLLKNTGFKRLAKFRTASLQIKEATTPEGTSKYFYDGAGRRVAKEVNGTRSDYLLMGSEVLKTYENGAPKAEYFLGLGRHGIKTNNSWKYYLTDGLGSTVSLTDDTGSTVAAYDYDDYGETSQIAGSTSVYNPFLYTGQEWDAELGMYNLRARHYAPSLGRFIARDPIGHAGGSNLYAYCNGDPIGHSDPSGLACKRVTVLVNNFGLSGLTSNDFLRLQTNLKSELGVDFLFNLAGGSLTGRVGPILYLLVNFITPSIGEIFLGNTPNGGYSIDIYRSNIVGYLNGNLDTSDPFKSPGAARASGQLGYANYALNTIKHELGHALTGLPDKETNFKDGSVMDYSLNSSTINLEQILSYSPSLVNSIKSKLK